MSATVNEARTQKSETPPRMLVPIEQALAMLGGIGRTMLYALAKEGHLAKVNIGRRGFITAESLQAYVARLSQESGA
jgi:hypothetical protein